jgi:hypothetical protein
LEWVPTFAKQKSNNKKKLAVLKLSKKLKDYKHEISKLTLLNDVSKRIGRVTTRIGDDL